MEKATPHPRIAASLEKVFMMQFLSFFIFGAGPRL